MRSGNDAVVGQRDRFAACRLVLHPEKTKIALALATAVQIDDRPASETLHDNGRSSDERNRRGVHPPALF
jgi:hypothetical protein